MTILCATDFSEAAAEATRVAARIAQRLGDRLRLVHVFQLPAAGAAGLDATATLEYDRLMREAVADALDDAATAIEDARVEVETRILEGSVPARLTEEADEVGARLVVLGSLGHGAVERLVVGSVTDRVSRLCTRPLLAVRGETAGFDAWARGERPLRVVMGLDRSSPSMAAVAVLRTLRAAGPVDVTFVHAYWPPGEAMDLGPSAATGFVVPDEEAVARIARDLTARMGDLGGEGRVSLEVWPTLGNLGFVLDRFAEDTAADLVLVGTHRRGLVGRAWRGGSSAGAMHHAKVSVLSVPVNPAEVARTAPIPRLERVLVATDLSERADLALRQAYGLLGEGGEVHLCTVIEGVPNPGERARLEAALRARVPAAAEALGIHTEVHVLEGDGAGKALVAAAERLGADAVVVGSRGQSGVARALLGSVTEYLMRHADRPVLVVQGPGS